MVLPRAERRLPVWEADNTAESSWFKRERPVILRTSGESSEVALKVAKFCQLGPQHFFDQVDDLSGPSRGWLGSREHAQSPDIVHQKCGQRACISAGINLTYCLGMVQSIDEDRLDLSEVTIDVSSYLDIMLG